MAKQYSFLAEEQADTNKPIVSINQLVQMWGCNDPEYVVFKIETCNSGFNYHLINLNSMSFQITRRIRPLSKKFGIGIYFDEDNPRFMSSQEVAELLTKVQVKERLEGQQAEEEKRERKD